MSKKAKALIIITVVALLIFAGVFGVYKFLLYRYPLHYKELILQCAGEFGLEPSLVAAVIWAESRFNENAHSHAGAMGLMQVLPNTGSWVAGKIGLEGFESQMLYLPETNLRIGCWYLSYLYKKFEGDMVKMLAGYNAGQGRVSEWEKDWPEGYAPGVEDIPYEETRNYIRNIEKAKKIYEMLYDF